MGYCDQASVRFVPVGSGGGMADRTDWEWMENKAVEYADTFHIEKVCDSWNNLLKKVS